MSQIQFSACVNHPAVEASARCKSCMKPICNACKVMGPTGVFCSSTCKEKYEQFVERAAKLDQMRKPKAFGKARIVSLLVKVIILAVLVLAAAVVASIFGVDVPYVGGIAQRVREVAGI